MWAISLSLHVPVSLVGKWSPGLLATALLAGGGPRKDGYAWWRTIIEGFRGGDMDVGGRLDLGRRSGKRIFQLAGRGRGKVGKQEGGAPVGGAEKSAQRVGGRLLRGLSFPHPASRWKSGRGPQR